MAQGVLQVFRRRLEVSEAIRFLSVAKGRIAEIYVISSPDRIQQLMNYRRSH